MSEAIKRAARATREEIDPSEAAVEAVARAICRSWLKPREDQEPEFTNQRWPLFKNDALSAIRAYHMSILEAQPK